MGTRNVYSCKRDFSDNFFERLNDCQCCIELANQIAKEVEDNFDAPYLFESYSFYKRIFRIRILRIIQFLGCFEDIAQPQLAYLYLIFHLAFFAMFITENQTTEKLTYPRTYLAFEKGKALVVYIPDSDYVSLKQYQM